jgi:hypothetical protein
VKKILAGLSAAFAAGVVATFAITVSAQEKKATTPPAAKTETKAKSACNAMKDEAACKADTGCQWIKASVDAKTGKVKRKAYCRTKPKPAAKKK